MTKQELELLISLTSKKIYSIAKDNNLTDAEYDYYIYSILYNISIGLCKDAYKILKETDPDED